VPAASEPASPAAAAPDVSWTGRAGTFNLRVAAVIVRGGDILICTVDGVGHWFLPGGRIHLGEPSDLALTRELAEELGHDLPGGRLALVVENVYRDPSLSHEIGLYYRVTWPDPLDPADLHRGTEPGHHFRWVPMAELGPAGFQPAGLIPILPGPAEGLRHVILAAS
jgi:ADP-ribose pyrophosphatase YjhB (NUDIX family)